MIAILSLSLVLQLLAAATAIHAARATGQALIWLVIAAAALVLSVRQVILLLAPSVAGSNAIAIPIGEWLILATSLLLLTGVAAAHPSFRRSTRRLPPPDSGEHDVQLQRLVDTLSTLAAYVDENLQYRFVNRAYTTWFGQSREQIVGHTIPQLLGDEVFQHRRHYVDRVLQGEHVRFEAQMPHHDGQIHDVEITYVPDAVAGHVRGFFVLVQDISQRKQVDRIREAQLLLTRVLAEAESLADASKKVLGPVWESLGFKAGGLWELDEASRLHRVRTWHAPTVASEQFDAISDEITFEPGVGLPGRVWQTSTPHWITRIAEDENFPRREVAARAGLQSAVGFPILDGQQVIGVMEFFTSEVREADPEMLAMMASIGGQFGQFIRRLRAVEELRQSEARHKAAVETALDCIVAMDHEGIITEFNPAAEKIFGYTRSEVIGQEMGAVIIPPQLRAAHTQGLRRYLQTGEARVLGQRIEIPAMRRSGEQFLVELAITRNPGEPPTFTGFMRDITASRAAAEALRQSEERYRHTFEHAGVGVAHVDEHGRLLRVNQTLCDIVGYPEDELLQQTIRDITHPDDRSIDSEDESALRAGQIDRYQLRKRYVHKNGQTVWVHLTMTLQRNDNDDAAYSIAVVEDISAQVTAEEKLRELAETLESRVRERTSQLRRLATELTEVEQRERKRLAQALHDHLQQILAYTKMTLSPLASQLDGRERQTVVEAEELLAESIEISRSLSFELSPPVLHDAGLADALHWLSRHMKKRFDLTVCVNAEPTANPSDTRIAAFLFDAARELLVNVVKHAQTKEAFVSLERAEEDNVKLQILDHGDGLPQPLDSQGFGLFSVKERLELLGGQMLIDSKHQAGTTITLLAPRGASAAWGGRTSTALSPDVELAVGEQMPPLRVLVVDDHTIMRRGLVRMLQEVPGVIVVAEAADGEEAVSLAQKHRPDAILMDVSMPRMNGIEATRRIRAELPETRVIGLSMHESEDMERRMRQAGAAAYLAKAGPWPKLTAALFG